MIEDFYNASDTQLQPYKYSSKELDRENGLDLYDSQARWYDSMLPGTTTQDPLATNYYPISPYTWCAGNPVRFVDPKGLFSMENIYGENNIYQVVAIFPEDRNDDALKKDYMEAKKSGIPMIMIENLEDLNSALETFTGILGSSSNLYTINSHGDCGYFSIGKTKVDSETDFSNLLNAFNNSIVFVGACDTGLGEKGSELTQKLSYDTHSTVITSQHKIKAGYNYDGSDNLNYYGDMFYGKSYKLSYNGGLARDIYDVRISKSYGITWSNGLFREFNVNYLNW